MQALLLAALLTVPAPAIIAEVSGNGAPVVTPETAAATASTAQERSPNEFSRASESAGLSVNLIWPTLALIALAAASLLLARRRALGPRLLEVVESTGLGGKRSLVVARIGSELLILGVSDAGISLLTTRPAQQAQESASTLAQARRDARVAPKVTNPIANLLSRLQRREPAVPEPSFDACLIESTEDQELRRKLARGLSGSVR